MKQGIAWLLAGLLCACSAAEPAESLDSITARLDESGGTGRSLDDVPAALDAWIAAHPDSADAWIQYARYTLKSGFLRGRTYAPGTFERATAALTHAERLSNRNPNIDLVRGHILDLMGQPDAAEVMFDLAAQRGGDANPWLRLYRAELRQHQERWADALRDCDNVAARKDLRPLPRTVADECRANAHWALGNIDMAERMFREELAHAGDNAWAHGNFADFLLCERDDPDAALVEVRRARALMDYGVARETEAAALARGWSKQLAAGATTAAAASFEAATDLSPQPIDAFLFHCYETPALRALVRTGLRTKHLSARSVQEAVEAAAHAAEDNDASDRFGVYAMRVQSVARVGGELILGSAVDARDPQALSLVMTPDVQSQWRSAYGSEPEQALLGQQLSVIGLPNHVHLDAEGKRANEGGDATQLKLHAPQSILWLGSDRTRKRAMAE